MSLEDRFRQALADAISEVKSRLEAEFDVTVTDVKAEADRDRRAALTLAAEAGAAAVAEARGALQAELQAAFDGEKASLVATYEGLLAQAADAARLDATRLAEETAALADRQRQEAEDALARVTADAEATVEAIRSELRDTQASAVRVREESETAIARLHAEAAAGAAAVAEARGALQAELQAAFDGEKASLVATHEGLLAQAADAARLDATRLAEETAALADRQRQEAEDALARVTADAEATVEAIRSELRDTQASAVRVREESEAAIARLHAEAEAALARQNEEHTAEVSRLEAAQGTVSSDLRAALDTVVRERDEAIRQREELAAEAVRMRNEFDEATLASLRTEAQEAATLHSQAVDAHQSGALRMLESVRLLDNASSLSEVLDALTAGASKEAGRAAMLVVKGDHLIGWRTLGFGALDQEPRAIEQSTSDVGALAAAVNTGRPAVTGAGSVLMAPAFSDAPAERPGLAVPLLVAGRCVGVLYADPGTASPLAGWASPVEVLVRHAARCLEGLAVQRATAGKAGTARVAQSA